jgi:hypothetical protein
MLLHSIHLDTLTQCFEVVFWIVVVAGALTLRADVVAVAVAAAAAVCVARYAGRGHSGPPGRVRAQQPHTRSPPGDTHPTHDSTPASRVTSAPVRHRSSWHARTHDTRAEVLGFKTRMSERLRVVHGRNHDMAPVPQAARRAFMSTVAPTRATPYMVPVAGPRVEGKPISDTMGSATSGRATSYAGGLPALGHPGVDSSAEPLPPQTENRHTHE